MVTKSKYLELIKFIKDYYNTNDFIPLHRPLFNGNEKINLEKCIDSNFVSSVGKEIIEFEKNISKFIGSEYSILTVNGTAALHIALILAKVKPGDEVITQALSFVATCNAISYTGAKPILLDVDKNTMGLSVEALESFIKKNVKKDNKGYSVNKKTGKRISACVPMHTFGHPCEIEGIARICTENNILLIEDAAESLGSKYKNKYTGTFGICGITSFNGNKIITTGGGGAIFTNNEKVALLAKHLTTTAKIPHPYEYNHDQIGYNFRMPNINAVIGLAQLEQLPYFINEKRKLSRLYLNKTKELGLSMVIEPINCESNYWLNCILLDSIEEKNIFLDLTNSREIMTRPFWTSMNNLKMYKNCQNDGLFNSKWLQERVVCLPSSVK